MFSFFKSTLEKDLIKLGYHELVNGYRLKLKSNEWTKKQFQEALRNLHEQNKNKLENINNVNVSTRQSFDVDDTIVPLNLQNIQLEYIDYDYIYSTLLFEYNSKQRIHVKAIEQLLNLLQENFTDATINEQETANIKQVATKDLLHEATEPHTNANKNYLKAVYIELLDRSKS